MILFQIFLRKKRKSNKWVDGCHNKNGGIGNYLGAKRTILSCFLFFFLTFVLYFFIPEVVAQNFNSIAERSISIRTRNVKTFLVLITYQFILLYFSNKIIFCFIYICQSKFLTYVFLNLFLT